MVIASAGRTALGMELTQSVVSGFYALAARFDSLIIILCSMYGILAIILLVCVSCVIILYILSGFRCCILSPYANTCGMFFTVWKYHTLKHDFLASNCDLHGITFSFPLLVQLTAP